ncbi:hypothetical protein FFWV33_16115 [Flavobacterium faecale]|uniref:DUF6371 domain-containing protein n=1 Tax=Flavobacterium faecale TaxID=1355330 RepID=A0A2S1LGR6_9FLAO|nr:hypothetical protein FFWV33_16115 [Flavobacterium faecale]
MSDEFGRCDRETECQYWATPEKENNIVFEKKHIPAPKPSFHNLELLDKMYTNEKQQNNFSLFLETIFTREEVFEAEQKYFITSSNHFKGGATIFWQIDNLERLHAGKILQYDKVTGKRIKTAEGKGLINWVHSVLKLENFNLKQSLFGLHLIAETNQKTIAIVEAEKTAVIMSIFKPQYIWLATGSKSGFKYDLLKPIKDFNIIGFPDKSEFEDWNTKSIELNKVGFKIKVNDWLEKTDYPKGSDFADVLINETKNSK